MFDLQAHLAPRQQAVEAALLTTLTRFTSGSPERLVEAMRYSLLAPGKRLRPLLCVLACEAVGGTIEQALPAGCAVEMIHTYSLIHDDLPAMDDDDLRRGLPTCHVKFDEATAILAGDGLLTLAFEVLGSSYEPPIAAVSCVELARGAGAVGMVGGQMLDLIGERGVSAPCFSATDQKQGANTPRSPSEHLESIHRMKTGALFRSALRMGVIAGFKSTHLAPRDDCHLAERDEYSQEKQLTLDTITTYADAFGLAFQVTDDLLDVESSAEKTGKRVGKDSNRGKLTYPGLLGVNASRAKANELVERAVQAALKFGTRGEQLAELARFIARRDR